MPNTMQNFGVLQKPIRDKIRKVRSESLKPPQEVIDETGGENHKYFIVYVAQGQEIRHECTKEIWKRARGPKPVPGRKVPGMDHKIYHDFDIIIDPAQGNQMSNSQPKGLVIDIDMIPKNKYERGLVPADVEDVHEMTLRVNQQTGGLEIIQIPPRVRDNRVTAILAAIDKLDEISPGMEIAGAEVNSVAGNQVVLEVAGGGND